MENSSMSWFPELGGVDNYYDFVDEFTAQNSVHTQEEIQKQSSRSPESYTSNFVSGGTTICFGGSGSPESLNFETDGGFDRPVKRLKVDNVKPSSFHHVKTGSVNGVRSCSVAREHVLAERKRREKLALKFIALSAILPGLQKADKVSVLEEAIKHVKELQERVKQLEEQGKKTRYEESVVVAKTTPLNIILPDNDDEDHSCSSDDNVCGSEKALPEIEVRFSDDNVLIRLHCEKHGKILSFFLREVEMLPLTVMNSFMTRFAKHAMDFTLVAKMDENFCMKPNDLVKHLQCITRRFMSS